MRDSQIHVPKDVIVTYALIQEVIVDATGLVAPAPKTVTTGCGRRRPYAMTSTEPAAVTCLACRDHAAGQHDEQASIAAAAVEVVAAGVEFPPGQRASWLNTSTDQVSTVELAELAQRHRVLAEEFRQLPGPQRQSLVEADIELLQAVAAGEVSWHDVQGSLTVRWNTFGGRAYRYVTRRATTLQRSGYLVWDQTDVAERAGARRGAVGVTEAGRRAITERSV